MNNYPTLTVGIPAYNEEANIKNLLSSMLGQKQLGFTLEKIVVISDGSTDNTSAIVKSFSDPRVNLTEFEKRQGLIAGENAILKITQSDILVLLDGDVVPTADSFLEQIIKPFNRDEKIALVGADTKSVPALGFLESVASFSHEFKTDMYKRIANGNNLYLCHGRARAFSKSFYSQIHWEAPYAEDAFSYLVCKQKGFNFAYAPDAGILFRSPATLKDYIKQSRRFQNGIKLMEKYFDKNFVKKEYHIPLNAVIKSGALYFLKNPVKFISYLFLFGYARFFSGYKGSDNSYFEISESTKKVI